MVSLLVKSSVFGDGNAAENLPEVTLRLASERIELAEVIRRAVRQQIEALRDRHRNELDRITAQLRRQYLASMDVTEQARHGKVALATKRPGSPGDLDIEAEAEQALDAFRRGLFRVFVDSEPVDDPGCVITVTGTTNVTFLRLVPLVGG